MNYLILRCVSVSLLLLSIVQYVQCKRPIIRQTVNGPVQGILHKHSFGEAYAFLAIPYAKPPITGQDPHTGQMVDRRFKV